MEARAKGPPKMRAGHRYWLPARTRIPVALIAASGSIFAAGGCGSDSASDDSAKARADAILAATRSIDPATGEPIVKSVTQIDSSIWRVVFRYGGTNRCYLIDVARFASNTNAKVRFDGLATFGCWNASPNNSTTATTTTSQ
jgi:hypothetical protein